MGVDCGVKGRNNINRIQVIIKVVSYSLSFVVGTDSIIDLDKIFTYGLKHTKKICLNR